MEIGRKMIKQEKEMVMGIVDNEGFDYAFCDYTNFPEIEDSEFHKAREKYVEAAKKLKEIIGFDDY